MPAGQPFPGSYNSDNSYTSFDENGNPTSSINMNAAGGNPSQYRVSLDALLLNLDHPLGQPLAFNKNTNATLLSTGDLDQGMNVGPRLTLDYLMDGGTAFEIGYFGIYDWNANQNIFGAADLRLPSTLGLATNSFAAASEMQFSYKSQINSGELNILCGEKGEPLQWLFGLRFVALYEQFRLLAVDNVNGNGYYNVTTQNDLFGAQVGGRWRQQVFGCLDLESVFKAGLYSNGSEQDTLVTNLQYTNLIRNLV